MYALYDATYTFIDVFDTDGEALVYAIQNSVKAPFQIRPL